MFVNDLFKLKENSNEEYYAVVDQRGKPMIMRKPVGKTAEAYAEEKNYRIKGGPFSSHQETESFWIRSVLPNKKQDVDEAHGPLGKLKPSDIEKIKKAKEREKKTAPGQLRRALPPSKQHYRDSSIEYFAKLDEQDIDPEQDSKRSSYPPKKDFPHWYDMRDRKFEVHRDDGSKYFVEPGTEKWNDIYDRQFPDRPRPDNLRDVYSDGNPVAEAGPFSYGAKKPRKGSVADLAAQKRKEQERDKQPVEPRDHMVGVARVKNDVAEGSQNQVPWEAVVNAIVYDQFDTLMNRYGLSFDDIEYIVRQHGFRSSDDVKAEYGQGVAEGEKKPHPKTWHDVDPKLGKAVDKMSQAEKVKKGLAHPDTLKKKGVAEGISVVDQDYDLDQMILTLDIEGKKVSFTYWDYDENFANAERRDVFDQLQKQPWYAKLDHPTRMEILDAAYRAIRGLEPQEYRPTVGDEPLDEQGVAEGEHPKTWHDVDPKLGKQVDKMSQAEKVSKGFAHSDTLKKKTSFIQKLDAKLQQLGYTPTQEGNVYRWTSPTRQFVEVEPNTEDPGWYGWAEGQVTKSGKLNYGDSGNDSAKDIVAIFKSGGVFRKQDVAEGSVQDKLYKRHQELRKKRGAPDPEYYKQLGKSYDIQDDQKRYAHQAELKKKYGVTNEDRERYVEELGRAGYEIVTESATLCPECGGAAYADRMLAEKQDACYHKVKSRYKVWPSAYASGALVRCRKKGAANWGNKSKK